MSVGPEEPRERLNYFNGQRLAAADFRSEQAHHDGMRRVLNRSLYSAGVVAGLDVEIDPADRSRVKVRRGFAFDHLGREIFLPQDVFMPALGGAGGASGGTLVAVSYREQQRKSAVPGAWGPPMRIAAEVAFEILDAWPSAESGRVVIAQLELDARCRVQRIVPGARQVASPVKAQKVRPMSLVGEKDIDIANEKTLHFHIEDGMPERAVLILRAGKFSSIHYTEIGEHAHSLEQKIAPHEPPPDHAHKLDNARTATALPPQDVKFRAWVWPLWPHPLDFNPRQPYAFMLWNDPGGSEQDLEQPRTSLGPHLRITGTRHSHRFVASTVTGATGAFELSPHVIAGQATHPFGSSAAVPPPHQLERDGAPEHTYVRDLRVVLDDGNDITEAIRAQLARRPGEAARWELLGDGRATHAMAAEEGTGEIDLLALGFELGMGAHRLSFRLVAPKPGDPDYSGDPAHPGDRGGNIQYHLYID
jgi:hypothetical protein